MNAIFLTGSSGRYEASISTPVIVRLGKGKIRGGFSPDLSIKVLLHRSRECGLDTPAPQPNESERAGIISDMSIKKDEPSDIKIDELGDAVISKKLHV